MPAPPSPTPDASAARNHGFTLLQLLVSISILATLLSMVIPLAATVRETTRKVACASNLRQTGMLELAYATDHSDCVTPAFLRSDMSWLTPISAIHGYTPQGYCWDTWANYLTNWVGLDCRNQWNQSAGFMNYLQCPSAPFRAPKKLNLANANHWFGYSSYGMNTAVLGDTGSTGIWDFPNGLQSTTGWPGYGVGIPGYKDNKRKLARISKPVDVILLAEHRGSQTSLLGGTETAFSYWTDAPFVRPPMDANSVEMTPPATWGTWLPAFGWRDTLGRTLGVRMSHNGRSNFLFHDGHVSAMTPWETCTSNPADPNLWTGMNP